MSTIVVVKKNNKVVMGADTQYSQGSTKIYHKYQPKMYKILKFKHSYIGSVGSSAYDNVLTSVFRKHGKLINFDSQTDIFESLLKLHPILKDEYFVNTEEDDDDQEFESNHMNALIANKYGIFEVQSYREVHELELFWATGSGKNFALGAMHAVYEKEKDAKKIAAAGLGAACEFDDASGLPFIIKSMTLK